MRFFLLILFLSCKLVASPNMLSLPSLDFSIENRILAKVDKTPISVLDVKKQMDVLFHHHYPDLLENPLARLQFYQSSWRPVLEEMIHTELMLLDAKEKEVTVPTGEVHQSLIRRFGPSVIDTLEKVGITYAEAENSIEKEMIVQRMVWFYVNQKALQSVHPIDIRSAYRKFLQENPSQEVFHYRVLSVKGNNPFVVAENLYAKLRSAHDLDLDRVIGEFSEEKGTSLNLSPEFKREAEDVAANHLTVLRTLSSQEFSQPFDEISRQGSPAKKILYLRKKEEIPAPTLHEKYEDLRYGLIHQEAQKYKKQYMEKLRHTYLISQFMEEIPDSFEPFVLR
ncbi:MAG: hypothetical protein AAGF04_02215 [Chlamydiota bacterium]